MPFHAPVLRDRVVAHLAPAAPGLLVDATVGLAGHSYALLQAAAGFELLGLDRDPEALRLANQRLRPFAERVRLVNRPFSDLIPVLRTSALPAPAAILADLGCSSLQLDSPERGFSFQQNGPLDMRMGDGGRTAAELVNQGSEEELMRILWSYGEERRARAIVRRLVAERVHRPLTTTAELSQLVVDVLGHRRSHQIHPATRTFQALRIEINDELGELERFVEPAARALRPGGRLAVISFHSLEDRIVKHTLRRLEGQCTCPPDLPRCVCKPTRVLKVVTRRPDRPDEQEIQLNPRSRSARLRVAVRLPEDEAGEPEMQPEDGR